MLENVGVFTPGGLFIESLDFFILRVSDDGTIRLF